MRLPQSPEAVQIAVEMLRERWTNQVLCKRDWYAAPAVVCLLLLFRSLVQHKQKA